MSLIERERWNPQNTNKILSKDKKTSQKVENKEKVKPSQINEEEEVKPSQINEEEEVKLEDMKNKLLKMQIDIDELRKKI